MSRIPEWVVNHKERERETSSICLVLRSRSQVSLRHPHETCRKKPPEREECVAVAVAVVVACRFAPRAATTVLFVLSCGFCKI